MFHAKMNDEEDDELPAYEEEEEGQEQPVEAIEVEEIVIEEEPEEEGAEAPAAAPRKSAPAKPSKAKKAPAKKKAKAKPAANQKRKKRRRRKAPNGKNASAAGKFRECRNRGTAKATASRVPRFSLGAAHRSRYSHTKCLSASRPAFLSSSPHFAVNGQIPDGTPNSMSRIGSIENVLLAAN
jgi:outer membrane biosynthesis protein TonB